MRRRERRTSVPVLQKKTRSAKSAACTRRLASDAPGTVWYRFDTWHSFSAWSATAATHAGSEWPRMFTAMPAAKSRYSLPSVSYSTVPLPCVKTTGVRGP